MRISVIIPNLDSPVVDRAVEAVQRQVGVQADEILVVGRDRPGRLAGMEGIRLIETDGPRLPGAARSIGVAEASGDLLVFVDSDCVPEPDWLKAHLRRHQAGETVVGGAVRYDDENYWQLSDNLSMFHAVDIEAQEGPKPYLPTLNLSVRREAWEAVGPMDPDLPSGEDIDWTIRAAKAGHPPYLDPSAILWHRPLRTTPRAIWAHWQRSGKWMVGVRRRHQDVYTVPTWIYRPLALLLFAPLIAVKATLPLYGPGMPGRRYWHTLPAVYATMIAWCVGGLRPASVPIEHLGPDS